jgi:transcriptional regulator with XRE-family HTH domain
MDKTQNTQTLGEMIRSLRETKGKLLRQAAADLDLDQAVLSKLENGIILPNDNIIERLGDYYKVNPDELRVLAYADKILGAVGEFKHAGKVLTLVKEHLSTYATKSKERKLKQKGTK